MERQIYNYTVPNGYSENKIVLMVRDPNCLFVYWEITDYRRNLVSRHLNCDWDKLTPIIRLFDVTDREYDVNNANYYLDIKIHPLANNWYIKGVSPNRAYVADYGVINDNNYFMPILHSNYINTPRNKEIDITPNRSIENNIDKFIQVKSDKKRISIETLSSYSIYEK